MCTLVLLHTYEDAALKVKRSAVLQHLCSFIWLVNSAWCLTAAMWCEEGWELICSHTSSMSHAAQLPVMLLQQ